MLVSLITSIFTPRPAGTARPQCACLSAGGLVVMESSLGASQAPPSGQAGVGGGRPVKGCPLGSQAWH